MNERARVAGEARRASFFENRNVPNKPEEAPTGGTAENIIEGGKQFFRKVSEKVGGFFSGR
jgi:hypothetical protein